MKPFLKIAQFEEERPDSFANELFEPLTGDVNQYETPYYPSCIRLAEDNEEGIDDPVELTREQQLERLIALGLVVRAR